MVIVSFVFFVPMPVRPCIVIVKGAAINQNANRAPSSNRLAGPADVGSLKNGDVITPL